MKYANYAVTMAEVPDEISLCISITGCDIQCKGCHSSYLWEEHGIDLTFTEIDSLVEKNKGISCICLMGGNDFEDLKALFSYIKQRHKLKVAWYTGLSFVDDKITFSLVEKLDYLKTGPYNEELGGLDKRESNQKFWKITWKDNDYKIELINYKFWKDGTRNI